jgi:hypothetical protein
MTDKKHDNIYEALLAVYETVGYVQKRGTNSAQNYKYAGEKDFIEALRPAMIENKIIVFPSGVRSKQITEIRKTEQGKADKVNINVAAVYSYTFVHTPSGTSIITEVSGEGSDPLDKGSYKAMTGAYKYALRQTFMIETGNDPEKDEGNGNHNKTTGSEIIAAMDACANIAELNQVKADYKQDINRFKSDDIETYNKIITRGQELVKQFNDKELNDPISKVFP